MKAHKLRFIIILLSILSFSSCKKFLDEKSDSSLVVPSTLADLQSLLDDPSTQMQTPSLNETCSDDYFLTEEIYNSFSTEKQHDYVWNTDDYKHGIEWRNCYLTIYNSNLILELLEHIQRTPNNQLEWDNVKGTALFLRGYSFLNLVWSFSKAYDEKSSNGDLGIPLRLKSDFNIPSRRANVKETYERIVQDVTESISLLQNLPLHVYRPSKAAAYGLLARTYLSMGKYGSALDNANSCLKIKSDLIDYNNTNEVNVNVDFGVFKAFNNETIFYASMGTSYILHFPTIGNIDTVLYNSYEQNDIRKKAYFEPYNGYHYFKGSYTGDTYSFFTGLSTNEILLIRAECFARAGDIEPALKDLNGLLIKRWRTGTFNVISFSSATEVLNIILKERRKELLMRGLRWIDIKRLNVDGREIIPTRIVGNQIYKLLPNENRYALPLPIDIINITGMPQNPK